jgi:hypothetical protein
VRSQVRVALDGVKAVFHEPNLEREIGKRMVRSLRNVLDIAGMDPDEE